MRLPHHLIVCAALLGPQAAAAQTIGPEQAQTLQQQLRSWLSSLLGPGTKQPDLPPLQITGEGDHYQLSWPIPGLDAPADAKVTAALRPLDGGRWSVDDVRVPDAKFTMTMPESDKVPTGGPMKVAISIGQQQTHAVFDPSYATSSTVHMDLHSLDLVTDSAKQHQEQKLERYLLDGSLQPRPDKRLELSVTAEMDNWATAARMEGSGAVAIGADRVTATGQVGGISRDRINDVIAATTALIHVLPPDTVEKGSKGQIPPEARSQLRTLIQALSDTITSLQMQETVDGLKLEVEGMGAIGMKRLAFGFGGEAPEGKLRTWIDIALDELQTPALPPKIAAYLPHHIALRPSLSGVQTADLTKLALDATEPGADEKTLAPNLAAIFSHGGVDLGLDVLSFDVGPAKVEATGHLIVLSPNEYRGKARVVATGLDDLAAQAKTHPELQQALPVLVMARGLAKQDGPRLVWDIVSDGTAVTVNGLDLTQLGGGDKPKGKPQPAHPPAPGQQPRRQ